MHVAVGLSLFAYLIVMIGLGTYAKSKVETEEDYLVAGRRLPLWLAWGTLLATWFGAATVLGASDVARDEGMRGTILDPFAAGLALIVAGLFYAKPLWERKLLTTGDLFAQGFGPRTEVISSFVQALGYLPWIAAQYLALGTVLHHYFGLSVGVGILIAATFVLFLTMSGGMWSVTLTDTLQILLVLVSLVVLTFIMLTGLGNGSAIAGTRHAWKLTPAEHRTLLPEAGLLPVLFWSATWFNGIFGNIPGQDLMQRVFASKDSTTAWRACLLAGVLYITFGLLPISLGLGSRILLPDYDADGILLALADALLSLPMTCLFVVALVSIIVSTCTSALLSPAALLAHNLLGRLSFLPISNLVTNRLSVALITLCSLPLAFGNPAIIDLLDVAFEISLVALFFPFTMAIYGRPRGELPGLLSIGFGFTVWLIHRSVPVGEETFLAAIPTEFSGTSASVLGYYLGHFLQRSRSSTSTPTSQ